MAKKKCGFRWGTSCFILQGAHECKLEPQDGKRHVHKCRCLKTYASS
jgi:hypothetical protein